MKWKFQPYHDPRHLSGTPVMPKRKTLQENGESFGQRLARLRREAGFSQRGLASETGISHRMIAYYESQADHPPAHLLPALVRAFGVSSDVLLGLEEQKRSGRPRDNRLWRRFSQVEKLPSSARKAVVQYLDTVLENQKFKSAVEHG